MNKSMLIALILLYLGCLFLIAFRVEKKYKNTAARSPWVYILGLAVYCTAWTYYGSIGVASESGLSFLTIYLGPVIAVPLWIVVLRKVITISKANNISSIADFISLRYGNSRNLGLLITVMCAIAIVPYISLQLKAVSESFSIITGDPNHTSHLFSDSAFYISLILALFTAFYGTRSSDATDNRTGILFTVAIDSILKLVIFLIIGIYVTYYLFDGTSDIYEQASARFDLSSHFAVNNLANGLNWSFMIILSFLMIFLLPRQFHVTVVEYSRKVQIKHAIWAFPLYLLLFNVFVIFIAWAGKISLPQSANPDYYSVLLPMNAGNITMATIVFFGGLSAAFSMIVVSSLTLSTMISNNVILPYGTFNVLKNATSENNNQLIKNIRRITIFSLIIVAYVLFASIKNDQSLFSIGLISFTILAQLAPSFFIGLYWNRGSSLGAKTGIIAGFLVTCIIYVVPFIWASVWNDTSIIDKGYFGVNALKPDNFFGISDMTPITSAFFWSLFTNTGLYLVISVVFKGNYRERNYGEIFANSKTYNDLQESAFIWEGKAYVDDIKAVLVRLLGKRKAELHLNRFRKKYNIDANEKLADARLINYSEKLLSGIIGSVSAKTLLSNVIQEKPILLTEVLNVLEENKQAIATNKALKRESKQLQLLTSRLTDANKKLQALDKKKDSFLNTVAHELKTPITSIGISTEVLMDNEMPRELRTEFLNNIKIDTSRLANLINNILDLEKLSSGREKIEFTHEFLDETLEEAIEGIRGIATKNRIRIIEEIDKKIQFQHNRTKCYQVFTNILSNALKFIPKENGEIKIIASNLEDYILIKFMDNGNGIDPLDLPYIFDKFYQSQNQELVKPTGSGFGLSIVKTIVEMHGGTVEAKNKENGGAIFTIKFSK